MEQHMDVTGDESEYEMLYCVHDMLSLYCRHHELIYGHVPERIGLILKETERKMKVLETRIS
ncbi:hypothetical protein [Methanomethylophilus alvi]|jgi:hypothetical protein|nr:hypothetical protein [Methanomethylophilus alvi]AYQ54996.1 hypothetical protein BKD89_04150 [Methanomethylophilus alvi]MCI5973545.1 hypothetical protein [Methanomethylophilus alvi]MDD7480698.1 hypothetical protein [Methanomethylophilus alvi]MDY7061043.1 hypothetical protein [Methanomethylophilus alvi]